MTRPSADETGMKNQDYNVLKLLHETLDNVWRIEKHYLADAQGSGCDCPKLLRQMQAELQKHADALKAELARHLRE